MTFRSKPETSKRKPSRFGSKSTLGTLAPPLMWMLFIYIGSLMLLVGSAFFGTNGQFTTENLTTVVTNSGYFRAVITSALMAVCVTIVCLIIALPLALFASQVASGRWARRIIIATTLPLWAGYLVKVYSWKAIFTPDAGKFAAVPGGGFAQSVLGFTPSDSKFAVLIVLVYLWLPYMVLPIFGGLSRIPASLLDASSDLGAKPGTTFRTIVLPVIAPSIAAGSIFTFSLSLGDYITPRIITGGKFTMVGNLIDTLQQQNPSLSAALTLWPILIIVAYLFAVSRMGAFDNL